MKKIIYIILALLIVVPISSCNKFLDTEPFSTVSSEQFYKTASDAELALVGCYNVLNTKSIQGTNLGTQGGLYFMQLQNMLTGSTDEAIAIATSTPDDTAVGQASWNANTTYVRQVWFYFYAGIQRCNILLDKIGGITDLTDVRKNEIKGEARFLRGFYYMYLGMMFGGVPINTSGTSDVTAARSPLKDVFTQAISDLNFAYTNLPNRAGINGRANKWSAAGELAKLYAFMGSCKQNSVGASLNFPLNSFDWVNVTDSYTKVKTITDDIINNSGYKLTANYANLFKETTKTYQDEECLFMAEGSTDPVNGNIINMQNGFIPKGPNATVGGGVARLVPVGELFAKYNNNDPRRTNNLTGNITVNSAKETVDNAVYFVPNTITATSIKNNLNYYGGKFRMLDPSTKTITVNFWGGNYPIMRLAEIYLLRAEAVYALTGDLVTARADLSTVRQRAVGTINLTAVNNAYAKPDFITELLDERSRELCFEAMRHFDLMRFNRYLTTIAALTTDKSLASNNTAVPTLKQNFTPNKIWFPIPGPEIILNPNLVQNPNY